LLEGLSLLLKNAQVSGCVFRLAKNEAENAMSILGTDCCKKQCTN
jgi:hypothetical protein